MDVGEFRRKMRFIRKALVYLTIVVIFAGTMIGIGARIPLASIMWYMMIPMYALLGVVIVEVMGVAFMRSATHKRSAGKGKHGDKLLGFLKKVDEDWENAYQILMDTINSARLCDLVMGVVYYACQDIGKYAVISLLKEGATASEDEVNEFYDAFISDVDWDEVDSLDGTFRAVFGSLPYQKKVEAVKILFELVMRKFPEEDRALITSILLRWVKTYSKKKLIPSFS